MRIKLLCCLMVFLLALPVAAKPPKGDYTAPSSAIIDNTTFISANRILMFVTNHGNFGRDLGGIFGHDYGTWYPYPVGQDTSIINGSVLQDYTPNYASGLWVGAIDSATGDIRIVISEYDSEYVPGPMSGGTFMPDAAEFKVYKLYADSLANNPNQAYLDYMTYGPALGAPFWEEDTYDDEGNLIGEAGEPRIYGDQFLWAVYNDADPNQHQNDAGTTAPLGLEVKQALFAFTRDDPLGDVVFMRYRIFNKGNRTLENCYFSLWCDPDLGLAGDDLVGCDTILGLGFCYNGDNDDGQYGPLPPPCWAFDFFQGPMVAGEEADTAIMWDFQRFPGMKNLGMTSFNKYINGTDPDNFNQTYWFMQGLTKTGSAYSYNGQVLTFVLSGDPVAGTGDLDFAPDDRRWMQTTGPITFRPGDSTEIVAASIAAQAVDRKTSISLMKFYDRFAQLTYDSAFVVLKPPARPVVSASKDEGQVVLYWTDTSEIDHGTYPFEGYAIYQGASPSGPWSRITNLDINNNIEDVFDEVFDPTTGVPEVRLVQNGTNEGIKRWIVIDEDIIRGVPIKDANTYHYRVVAYCAFPEGPLGLRVLSSNATVSLAPQPPPAGYSFEAEMEETLPVTHVAGVSGGVITPIVVDPNALTGDTYRIVFADTPGIVIDTIVPDPINEPNVVIYDSTNIAWHLMNVTTGQTLLMWQTNQNNDNDYMVTEGFMVKVSGPPPGFDGFSVVANADGPLDPPDAGAFNFADFPVPTFRDEEGYITDAQQVYRDANGRHGQWGFHTADVGGGTCSGSTWDDYEAFLERCLRSDNATRVGIYDFEMRFTGTYDDPGVGGSYGIEWYNDDNVFWVPFELWRTGLGTPDDPSDDVRLPFAIIDDYGLGNEGNDEYGLESWGCDATGSGDWEHSCSSLNNDPWTDWVYWWLPADDSPGEAGYNACVADMQAGVFDGSLLTGGGTATAEILARQVLVSWNGGEEPPFVQDLPEQGTVFRLTTGKPNASNDVFEFTTRAKTFAASESVLDAIRAVPNPYYLRGPYDPNPGASAIIFHNLPEVCTIRIYNLGGDLVRTLDKDQIDNGMLTWDVLTENLLPVASGIYIYVVDAPGFGTKVGKLAVFVQQEVLDIY